MDKWHCNEASLETEKEPNGEEQSCEETQLGVKEGETKLLGLPWSKVVDGVEL
jgi:hypothetical protein